MNQLNPNELYLLHYICELSDDIENTKLIGVYSNYEYAKKSLNKLEKSLKHSEFLEYFEISETKLDRIDWSEGFFRYIPPTE